MDYDYRYLKPKETDRLKISVAKVGLDDRKLGYRRIEDAVIAPGRKGGVFAQDGFVVGTRLHRLHDANVPRPRNVKHVDRKVVYLGLFHRCWGHAITDCLKHLWFVIDGLPELFRNYELAYTTLEADERLPENLIELLKCVGVNLGRAFRVSEPTEFLECVVPDESFFADAGFSDGLRIPTSKFNECINRIRRTVGYDCGVPSRKVYFTRIGMRDQRDFGEESLVHAFAEAGFEIVRPESLTFREMVRLLGETAEFASTEGSCAHNSLFLPQGTKVLIVRKANYVNWHQLAINRVRDLDVTYVDSSWSPALLRYERNDPVAGPFFLYVNSRLAKILEVRRCFPLGAFIHYVGWGFVLHWGHWLFSGLRRLRH